MVGSRQRVAMIYRGVMKPRESEEVGLRTGGGFGAILVRAVREVNSPVEFPVLLVCVELEHELAVVGVFELVGERAVHHVYQEYRLAVPQESHAMHRSQARTSDA